MTQPHPHKDILIAIANGLDISEIEVMHSTWATWQPFKDYVYDIFSYPNSWKTRIKQKTVMFNGFELPEPVTETPNKEQIIYTPHPGNPYNYEEFRWLNSDYDKLALKKGLIHKNKENAIAWAIAMTPFPQNG